MRHALPSAACSAICRTILCSVNVSLHFIGEIRQFIFELEFLDRKHVPMHTCSPRDSCPTTSPYSIQTICDQMQHVLCALCEGTVPGAKQNGAGIFGALSTQRANKQKIMNYTEPEHRTSWELYSLGRSRCWVVQVENATHYCARRTFGCDARYDWEHARIQIVGDAIGLSLGAQTLRTRMLIQTEGIGGHKRINKKTR